MTSAAMSTRCLRLAVSRLTSLFPPVEKHKLVDTLVGHGHPQSNDRQPAGIDVPRSSVGLSGPLVPRYLISTS